VAFVNRFRTLDSIARSAWTRWEETVKNLITRMRSLMSDDSGQDLLEYALLVALIALVAYGAVQTSGQQVNAIFQQHRGQADQRGQRLRPLRFAGHALYRRRAAVSVARRPFVPACRSSESPYRGGNRENFADAAARSDAR
jgi:Flp pilus assembly pilin Flp